MSYRIAEAAERAGVPATTLRYYEQIGLVEAPAREANGYRTYSDADVERLRFITAVRAVGIPLSAVTDLARAYDAEDCADVAHHLVERVADQLVETQGRIAELVAVAARLQDVRARLTSAPAAGPCGPDCPCVKAGQDASPAAVGRTASRTVTAVPLTRRPEAPEAPENVPVACSLSADAVAGRVTAWQEVLARVTAREAIDGGLALTFPASADLAAEVARIAAAEQECCAFFTFRLRLTTGQLRLEVVAPLEARGVVAALFGTPA